MSATSFRKRVTESGSSARRLFCAAAGFAQEAHEEIREDEWYLWVKQELRVAAVITTILVASMWAKRIVEQSLGESFLNEHIMKGGASGVMQDIERRFT